MKWRNITKHPDGLYKCRQSIVGQGKEGEKLPLMWWQHSVEPAGAFPLLWSPEPLSFSRIDNHTHEIGAYDYFSPSNVNSTLYNSGRRSLNIPQPCLIDLISSKSNSATSTSSSLSLASFTISPVGPAEKHIFSIEIVFLTFNPSIYRYKDIHN